MSIGSRRAYRDMAWMRSQHLVRTAWARQAYRHAGFFPVESGRGRQSTYSRQNQLVVVVPFERLVCYSRLWTR